ncbi:MAG: heliorhodopsin HeR [Candidatus Heimdallarchaeota archaeon]|nr:heliorhodopsin HeR [Candidatus Heimdallarchaeota archaeon]
MNDQSFDQRLGSLRRWNITMAILHFIQGVLMAFLGYTVDTLREFSFELVTIYRYFETLPMGGFLVENRKEVLTTIDGLGIFVAIFLWLSALAHFLLAFPLFESYKRNLAKNFNPLRWFEYALSSSVMIVLIAMFFGVLEIWTLVLIFVINALMNLFGFTMELVNRYRMEVDDGVSWTPYIFGWIAGIMPWAVIFGYMLGPNTDRDSIPDFVWAILVVELILFMSFALTQFLQFKKVGAFKDYLVGEKSYQVLSLVAKTLLAWLVFGGLFQPN